MERCSRNYRLSSSTITRGYGIVNTDSGIVNTLSGKCQKVFTFDQNDCSRSTRIGVHVGPEYAAEAIKLITEQKLTPAEASRKLDVSTKSLRTWINQQMQGTLKASLGADKLTPDQLRIRELERELAIAKMERDILKKATAFFAKESK